LLLLPLLLVLALGCEAKNPNAPARVSGEVTYNGKPLPGGTITFYTDGAGTYPVAIGKDGTYEATGLPAGDLAVSVATESAKGHTAGSSYSDRHGHKMELSPAPPGFQQQQEAQSEYVSIPKKYANPKTSGLSTTLEPGRNTKSFELKE
jgi:hypothetical protein